MSFVIEIASVPDRDEVVAEIWYNDEMVAEMRQDNGETILEIYGKESGAPWSFKLQEWLRALDEAEKRLK